MKFVNIINGEMLDLRILWHVPKARKPRKTAQTPHRHDEANEREVIWLLLVLGLLIVILQGGSLMR